MHPQSRTVVELVAREEGDYGTGSCRLSDFLNYVILTIRLAYWKENYPQPRAATFTSSGAVPGPRELLDDDRCQEESQQSSVAGHVQQISTNAPTRSSSKAHAPRHISVPVSTRTSKTTRQRAQAQPLFLDSDGEDQSQNNGLHAEDAQTMQSSDVAPGRLIRRPKKTAGAVIADDDSDDGATFRGFQRRRARV